MPVISGSRGFEYDVEIVSAGTTYTVDGGDFSILNTQLDLALGDQEIPMLQFTINLNAVTRALAMKDSVRVLTRAIGESTYLVRFTGLLSQMEMDDRTNAIQCQAIGKEFWLKAQTIAHAEFGNELVENQGLGYSASGKNIYIDLDSTGSIQSPPIKASIHSGEHGCQTGYGNGTDLDIYDGGVGGTARGEIAYPFYHDGGELYGFATMLGRAANCNQDLVLEVCSPVSDTDFTPGVVLLSGSISAGAWTSETWYYLSFIAQNRLLAPGWYVAHFAQAASNVLSTKANPFWHIPTVQAPGPGESATYPYQGTTDAGTTFYWDAAEMSSIPLYLPDSQGAYHDLKHGEDYFDRYESSTNRIYICEANAGYKFKGRIYHNTLKALPMSKWTYWKGDMVYSSTIEDMLQDWAAGFYDTLDISVTEPTVKFQGLVIHNATVWEALLEFRKYNSIAWRMYEAVSGTVTLEVRDKQDVANWGSYTTEEQYCRTFYHGDDTSVDDYVAIKNFRYGQKLDSLINTVMMTDGNGNVMVNTNLSGDIAVTTPIIGGMGVRGLTPNNQAALSEYVMGTLKTTTHYGEFEAEIDLSTSNSVFVSANELVYVKSSNLNIDGAYVVSKIDINLATGMARFKISDKVSVEFTNQLTGKQGFKPSLTDGKKPWEDWDAVVDTSLEGVMSRRNPVDLVGGMSVFIDTDFAAAAYLTGTEYAIGIGDGSPNPSGDVLGNEIAMATCTVHELVGGGAILECEISRISITSTVFDESDIDVSEVALYVGGSVFKAVSIGTDRDGGSMSIAKPRPHLRKDDRKHVFFVRLPPA